MSEEIQQPAIDPNTEIRTTYGQYQETVRQAVLQLTEPVIVKTIGNMRRSGDAIELYPENHSPILPASSTHEMWLWFLQETEMAKLTNALSACEAPSADTRIPGLFLPALLLVKLVSIFDEALDKYIDANQLSMPPHPYRTLDRRLKFLDQQEVLRYTQALCDIKDMRNRVTHRPTSPTNWQAGQVTWDTLEGAISGIETVLQGLNMVGKRPAYEGFAERNRLEVPTDKPDVYMIHKYNYGLKESDKVIMQFTHSIEYDRLP